MSSAALCGSRPPLAAGRSYSCLSLWLALRSYAPETCERYEVPKSSAPSAWATMGRSRKGCLLEFSRHLRNAAASRQPPPTPYGAMRYGNDGAPESRLHTQYLMTTLVSRAMPLSQQCDIMSPHTMRRLVVCKPLARSWCAALSNNQTQRSISSTEPAQCSDLGVARRQASAGRSHRWSVGLHTKLRRHPDSKRVGAPWSLRLGRNPPRGDHPQRLRMSLRSSSHRQVLIGIRIGGR